MNARSVREILALAVIGAALCLTFYHQIMVIAPLVSTSAQSFIAHGEGIDFLVFDSEVGLMDLQSAWKPRLLSNILASVVTRGSVVDGKIPDDRFAHLVGLWSACWLGLVFLLYLGFLGRTALIPILGTYVGVSFSYMPGIGDRVYPWDMPPVFFFALFVCLLIKDRLPLMLVFLPIATLFKETAIVLAPAFLFIEGSAKKRIGMFGAALFLSGATKIAANLIADVQGHLVFDTRLLLANLRFTLTGEFPHKGWYMWADWINHPLLLNAGLLTAFFLYPFRDENKWMLRTVVVAFMAGTLAGAVVFEYRTWIGLIPVLLYPLYRDALQRHSPMPGVAR